MLRINAYHSREKRRLELIGKLMGPWVEELRQQCNGALAGQNPLTLDLGQLSFVDAEGAKLLLLLQAGQVQLSNCSRLVAEQIRSAANHGNRGAA